MTKLSIKNAEQHIAYCNIFAFCQPASERTAFALTLSNHGNITGSARAEFGTHPTGRRSRKEQWIGTKTEIDWHVSRHCNYPGFQSRRTPGGLAPSRLADLA
jgi:hypothetical protein